MDLTNQQLRREILLQLYASRPAAVSAATMERNVQRTGGAPISAGDLRREAEYLVSGGLLTSQRDPITGETRYQITKSGVDAFEDAR